MLTGSQTVNKQNRSHYRKEWKKTMDVAIIIPLALIVILQLGANITKKHETGYKDEYYHTIEKDSNSL